jgi:serine/threonine protein kinase
VGAIILLLLLGCIAAMMGVITRSGRGSDDWEIDYNELEVGEQLGAGGFGQVFKATWKGTEVAVKVVAADKISREMEKSFKDEVRLRVLQLCSIPLAWFIMDCHQVRVMTALRHPNVVLFMAASTKPPKMCIVMEFMALGSLFDVRAQANIRHYPQQL